MEKLTPTNSMIPPHIYYSCRPERLVKVIEVSLSSMVQRPCQTYHQGEDTTHGYTHNNLHGSFIQCGCVMSFLQVEYQDAPPPEIEISFVHSLPLSSTGAAISGLFATLFFSVLEIFFFSFL